VMSRIYAVSSHYRCLGVEKERFVNLCACRYTRTGIIRQSRAIVVVSLFVELVMLYSNGIYPVVRRVWVVDVLCFCQPEMRRR
jgi:hypothetical protein